MIFDEEREEKKWKWKTSQLEAKVCRRELRQCSESYDRKTKTKSFLVLSELFLSESI